MTDTAIETVVSGVRVDAKRLNLAMAAADMRTDEELARRSGVTTQTLRNIRRDGTCSLRVLGDLARACAINPIDLLITPGFPDPKVPALAMS